MASLKIQNLRFSYNDVPIFNNLNFTLRKNKSLSIIGLSGSGKTTLLHLLNCEFEYEGNIFINDTKLSPNKVEECKRIIGVVFDDNFYHTNSVMDEICYFLTLYKFQKGKTEEIIKELNDFFSINKISNKKLCLLSKNDKILIKILSYAVTNPCYLALDDLLYYLDKRTKILLLNYLNSKNIILINVTSDLEDVLFTDYLMCLYNGISGVDGKVLDVLKEEKILKRLGFSLPFMVDLSIQLNLYGLIDKFYLNKEKLVKDLWK